AAGRRARSRGDEPPDAASARARAEERAPAIAAASLRPRGSGGRTRRARAGDALALGLRELLPDLPLEDRELVLDHLARERLVPGEAAHPVLAGLHDVASLLLRG